jgi:hypothetical protein
MLLVLPALIAASVFSQAQLAMGGLPIGYDVSTSYLFVLQQNPPQFFNAITNFNLLYWILGLFSDANIDSILLLKITGVILPILLIASFTFLLAQVFPGKSKLTLLGSLLFLFQLATLRFSWDLYRNTLGLIFALTAIGLALLLVRKAKDLKLVANIGLLTLILILSILTFGSHQMVAFALLLFAILALIVYLLQQILPKLTWLIRFIAPILFLVLAPSISTETYKLVVSDQVSNSTAHELFLLLYASLIPLALVGVWKLRSNLLASMTTVLLVMSLSPMLGSREIYLWDRWMYFLVVPFTIYATAGLAWLYTTFYQNLGRYVAVATTACLFIAVSAVGFRFLRSAESLKSPFTQESPNLFSYTPQQFLWNSIGFESYSDLERATEVVVQNHDGKSLIYASPQYVGFTSYFFPETLKPFLITSENTDQTAYTPPAKRYYVFGVNYGRFAITEVLEGSPRMQPVQLFDASRQ